MRTIYTNGQVFTGKLPLQEAFIVEDGVFVAAGSTCDMLAQRAPEDAVVPLQGRFVCPGFNDSHMHLLSYGNTMDLCDLTQATRSLTQLQEALRTFAREKDLTGNQWLLGRGWNQDYFIPATGVPTRYDLDEVSRELPVCITRCCGHSLVVNSRALDLLGIDENTPCPEGGGIEKGPDGKLNGVFLDSAMPLVSAAFPAATKEDVKRKIRQACRALNAVGVTSCQSDDLCSMNNVSWQDILEAFRELEAEGSLTVRVNEQSQFSSLEELDAFLRTGQKTGCGSPMFRIGPMKLLGDGSLGARTAYLSQDYADAPGERGLAIFTPEQLRIWITKAHEGGMQIAIHAIGDGILDDILDAYEYAFARCPREDHRSGIVHVQLTRADQLQRMQKLQMHAYVQSIFIDYDAHIVYQRAGSELANTSYAFHSLKALGLHVSNGTDCPVEGPNPMRGLQCAVTRQPLDGSVPPYLPEEAMSVEEALQSYTLEGAHASFEESFKGQIKPGMAADFVLLDGNPFTVPANQISSLGVEATYLNGRCVYSRS